MNQDTDPEGIDLAVLTSILRRICGESVAGAVVGRTRLYDEVARHLGCSLLMGETVVDARRADPVRT